MTVAAPQLATDPLTRLSELLDDLVILEQVDGVTSASGTVRGTPALAFATDPSRQGGAMGIDGCAAITSATDEAVRRGVAVIGIWHSGGARLAEGVGSLHAVALQFAAQTRASGAVPQISVVLGPAAGGAAYGPALTDFVILGPAGRIFVTGPDVIRRVTGEDVDMLRLGGPEPHGRRSGVTHLIATTDDEALRQARELVTLLGDQAKVDLTATEGRPDPFGFLPDNVRRAYDIRPVLSAVLDGPGLELQSAWSPSITTTLGRLCRRTVGVVANNPMRLGGCLDASSAEKAARFVRTCDAFGVPLLFLVDVPGYLPGVTQEWDGVVRRGAKLLHAYAEATVPKLTVVLRKSFGGAFIAMGSRGLGADRVYAWPGAQVDVMGGSAAVEVLHRKVLAGLEGEARMVEVERLTADHLQKTGGIQRAIDVGAVDQVIDPATTRRRLAEDLADCADRRGAHGNIPL